MAKDDKSFAEILKEAPKSHEADTVTLSGRLARCEDPGNFVLYVGEGRPLTLPVSAVKKHTVLGQSLGHPIVQLEIERKDLPAGQAGPVEPLKPITADKSPYMDWTAPALPGQMQDPYTPPDFFEGAVPDPGKALRDKPFYDKPIQDLKNLHDCKPARDRPPQTTAYIAEQIDLKPIRDATDVYRGPYTPPPHLPKAILDVTWGQYSEADPAARVPFSLATPHQVSQQYFEAQHYPVHTYPWDPNYWVNHDRHIQKAISDPSQEQLIR